MESLFQGLLAYFSSQIPKLVISLYQIHGGVSVDRICAADMCFVIGRELNSFYEKDPATILSPRISPRWILDSIEAHALLDVRQYDGLEDYARMGISNLLTSKRDPLIRQVEKLHEERTDKLEATVWELQLRLQQVEGMTLRERSPSRLPLLPPMASLEKLYSTPGSQLMATCKSGRHGNRYTYQDYSTALPNEGPIEDLAVLPETPGRFNSFVRLVRTPPSRKYSPARVPPPNRATPSLF